VMVLNAIVIAAGEIAVWMAEPGKEEAILGRVLTVLAQASRNAIATKAEMHLKKAAQIDPLTALINAVPAGNA
jgi:hypothetical protein